MIPRCPACPQSLGEPCHAYEHLCQRHSEEPARWRSIVLRHNAAIDARMAVSNKEGNRGGTGEPARLYPSLARQAWNASKATGQFVASGFALASEEERARRLAICREPCEFYDVARGRCTHKNCGCFMEIKVKALAQKCPIAKW